VKRSRHPVPADFVKSLTSDEFEKELDWELNNLGCKSISEGEDPQKIAQNYSGYYFVLLDCFIQRAEKEGVEVSDCIRQFVKVGKQQKAEEINKNQFLQRS
jgi:hypothetical protein